MPKNILMVCYYYPPITDVGSKRSVAFSKYLRRSGWQPHVISVKNPDPNYCMVGNELPPEGVNTYYARSLVSLSAISGKAFGFLRLLFSKIKIDLNVNYFYQLFCVPDIFIGWIPLTVLRAVRLIRRENIDIIYVSCTPYTSALIGIILKKLTGRPLIVDFRDQRGIEEPELTRKKFPLRLRRKIEWRFIKRILKDADLFIVTTREIKDRFLRQHPGVAGKIETIYNGFDADYLGQVPKSEKFDKFTVIYTGDFYFYALESMVFFEALNVLKQRSAVSRDNFQFLYYGDGHREIEACAERFAVQDLVVAHPRVPYEHVLQQLSKSHMQLIRIVKPMISTKVFEGISMNIPFLATIPEGEVQDIITTYSPGSAVVTEESAEQVAEAILEHRRRYGQDLIEENHVDEFLAQFSREHQTHVFEKTIERAFPQIGRPPS